MIRVEFAPRARRDVKRIDEWWRSNRPASPELFSRELAWAVRMLRASPELGPPHESKAGGGVRRLLLRQTQFHVYYRYDSVRGVVGIAAVWGTQRGRTPAV